MTMMEYEFVPTTPKTMIDDGIRICIYDAKDDDRIRNRIYDIVLDAILWYQEKWKLIGLKDML